MKHLSLKEISLLYREGANADLNLPAYKYYDVGKVPSMPQFGAKYRCRWCGKRTFDKESLCSDTCRASYKAILPRRVSLKESIKYRDNFICQECGCNVAEVNEFGVRIPKTADGEIHHRVFVRDGGTSQPSNLVLLCHDCHSKYHKKEDEELRLKVKNYTFEDVLPLRPLVCDYKDFEALLLGINYIDSIFPVIIREFGKECNIDECPFENVFQSFVAYFSSLRLYDFPTFIKLGFEGEHNEDVLNFFFSKYEPLLDSIWNVNDLAKAKKFVLDLEYVSYKIFYELCGGGKIIGKKNEERVRNMFCALAEEARRDDSAFSYPFLLRFFEFGMDLLQKRYVEMENGEGMVLKWDLRGKKSKVKPMNGNKYL